MFIVSARDIYTYAQIGGLDLLNWKLKENSVFLVPNFIWEPETGEI
jgi:hypothetical protein